MRLEFSQLVCWFTDRLKLLGCYFSSFNAKSIAIAISVLALCAVRFWNHGMSWTMDLTLPTLIFLMVLAGVGVNIAAKKFLEQKLKRSADVITTNNGVEYSKGQYKKSINWDQISSVACEWSGGFEDPNYAIDIQVHWVITGENRDSIRVQDNKANRCVLLAA
ncbi:MAG: hypothetical protein ACXWJD_05625, partial [Burkholderiaceae bacterium]